MGSIDVIQLEIFFPTTFLSLRINKTRRQLQSVKARRGETNLILPHLLAIENEKFSLLASGKTKLL